MSGLGADALDDALGAQTSFGLGEVVVDGSLGLDPVDVATDALLERGLRLVTNCADAGDVGDERTDFAGAELAAGERLKLYAKAIRDDAGEVADAGGAPAAHVDGQAIERVRGGDEEVGAGDVFHEAKVPGLTAVLVHDRRQLVEEARAEDGDDAGIGVEERLARTVGAGVTEGDGGDAGLLAPEQDQAFLVDLGEGVDGFAAAGSGLRCGDGRGGLAAERAMYAEVAGAELLGGAEHGNDVAVFRAQSSAFAVDGLGAGDHYFADGEVVVTDDLKKLGGAEGVDEDVLRHLGHVAAVGRLVEDDVDILKGGVHRGVVLNLTLPEVSGGIDPGGLAELVGLWLKIVEDADRPTLTEEQIDDVRADESGAAGDERALLVGGGHELLLL